MNSTDNVIAAWISGAARLTDWDQAAVLRTLEVLRREERVWSVGDTMPSEAPECFQARRWLQPLPGREPDGEEAREAREARRHVASCGACVMWYREGMPLWFDPGPWRDGAWFCGRVRDVLRRRAGESALAAAHKHADGCDGCDEWRRVWRAAQRCETVRPLLQSLSCGSSSGRSTPCWPGT